MALPKKNVLITGGSGFIGRNICESFLSQKYRIIAPSHKELDLMDEFKVSDFFRENKIDVIIYCAGKPSHRNAKNPTNIFYADMRMFLNLIRNEAHYKKMIIIGSGAVYDQRFPIIKAREEDFNKRIPADEHGLYRYTCAKLIEKMDNIVELRLFGIFGKYEDYAIRFISNAICKTLFDLPITIKQNRKFDYLFIDDLMPVLDYFIEHKASHKSYNITPDNSIELLELAQKIKKIFGKDLPIMVKISGMGLEYSGNNSRLKAEISNLKFTDIDAAIKNLYNWYNQNKNLINKDFLLADK